MLDSIMSDYKKLVSQAIISQRSLDALVKSVQDAIHTINSPSGKNLFIQDKSKYKLQKILLLIEKLEKKLKNHLLDEIRNINYIYKTNLIFNEKLFLPKHLLPQFYQEFSLKDFLNLRLVNKDFLKNVNELLDNGFIRKKLIEDDDFYILLKPKQTEVDLISTTESKKNTENIQQYLRESEDPGGKSKKSAVQRLILVSLFMLIFLPTLIIGITLLIYANFLLKKYTRYQNADNNGDDELIASGLTESGWSAYHQADSIHNIGFWLVTASVSPIFFAICREGVAFLISYFLKESTTFSSFFSPIITHTIRENNIAKKANNLVKTPFNFFAAKELVNLQLVSIHEVKPTKQENEERTLDFY